MKNILLFLISIALAACSGAKPSDSQIKEQFLKSSETVSALYKVSEFEKVNGIEKDDHTYIASVKYNMKFTKGFSEVSEELDKTAPPSMNRFQMNLIKAKIRERYGDFKQGDVKQFTNELTFVKTDNGWIMQPVTF